MIVVYIIPLSARAGFDRAHGACMGLNGNTRPRRRRRQWGEEASRVMHEVAGGGATPRSCIWLLQPPPVSSVCTYSRRVNRSCAHEAFDLLLRYESFLNQPCILAFLYCISPQYRNSQWETTSALTRCTVANSLCHAPVNTIDCRILRCTRAAEHIAAKSRQIKTTGHHIAYEELGQSEGATEHEVRHRYTASEYTVQLEC